MKSVYRFALLGSLLIFSAAAHSQTYVDVIDPDGNPSLWGLEWMDGSLYATNTLNDEIIQINPETGAVTVVASLSFDPRGIAWDGTNWRVSTGFDSSSPEIFMIAPDGTNLGSIPAPSELTHGLTLHDGLLFAARAYPNEDAAIVGLDPVDGDDLETIAFPQTQPGGITFIDFNTFWATNVGDDGTNIEEVYRMDRISGNVLQTLELPDGAGRPRGLAFDGSRFMYLVVREGTPYVIYKIDLLGSGNPEITLSTTSIDFNLRIFGFCSGMPLTIGNTGDADLEISNVQITGPDASVFASDLTDATVPPAGTLPVQVDFCPTEFGERTAALTFETNDVTLPVATIDLAGIGVFGDQHIAIEPGSLDFGDVRIEPLGRSSAVRRTLAVVNEGLPNLTVTGVEIDNEVFSVIDTSFPFLVGTLDTVFVDIEFRPTQVQVYSGTLTTTSDDPTNPSALTPLSGAGINPILAGGDVIWSIETPDNPNTNSDNPKIFSIVVPGDLTGDGVPDLVFASSNYLVWAVDGNGWGEPSILWTFNTCPNNNNCGAVSGNGQLFEYGMTTGADFNGDGIRDIVIGTEGGNDHVYLLSGADGSVIWEVGSDTDPYLAGYYSVAIGIDVNSDGVPEIATGTGTASDQSPNPFNNRRVYLLDGASGDIVREYATGLPNFRVNVFKVSGLDDYYLVAGGGEEGQNFITAWDMIEGDERWSAEPSYAPFLLEKNLYVIARLNDVVSAGVGGVVEQRTGSSGHVVWSENTGSSTVWDITAISDPGASGLIAMGTSGPDVTLRNGAGGGGLVWSYNLDDQVFDVGSFPDLDGDEIDEILAVGKSGRAVLLSDDGSLIWDYVFGDGSFEESGEVIVSVPDVDGNGVPEVAFGTRDGRAFLLYGGGDPIVVANVPEETPERFAIDPAYPNPFNPSTTLSYHLPEAASVQFTAFDVLGRQVWINELDELPAGSHALAFDGSGLATGVYFVRMTAGAFSQTRSFTLVK